jgi:uncharacterized protein
MNKFFAMMVALMATLFVSNAMAWNPPPTPAPQSWISDPSHVLSDAAHARLDAKLKVINQSSANEMAALILPTLDGDSIEDAGDLTFKAWGVGKKDLDNGVLVVLSMKEHKSRISTGKGVEGDLPDLKSNDILQAMRPYLRSGDVEGALGYAFDQSSKVIANHKAEAQAAATKAANSQTSTSTSHSSCQVSAPGSDTNTLPLILLFLGVGLVSWWLIRRANARSRAEMDQTEADTEALLNAQRERQTRLSAEREAHRRAEEARLQREAVNIPTPVVEVPAVPTFPSRPIAPTFPVAPVVAAAVVVNEAAEAEARRHHEAEARRQRLQREEDDNRRRREQAEADDRRRREESSSSSYSSGSSYDSGSSSSGGGWDSGGSGGFGGGDSGGGGSSGSW